MASTASTTASTVSFTTSEKGKRKLCYEAYVYNYVKKSQATTNLTFWTCEQYWSDFCCKAKVHLLNDQVTKQVGHHNHPPNVFRQQVSVKVLT